MRFPERFLSNQGSQPHWPAYFWDLPKCPRLNSRLSTTALGALVMRILPITKYAEVVQTWYCRGSSSLPAEAEDLIGICLGRFRSLAANV